MPVMDIFFLYSILIDVLNVVLVGIDIVIIAHIHTHTHTHSLCLCLFLSPSLYHHARYVSPLSFSHDMLSESHCHNDRTRNTSTSHQENTLGSSRTR